MAVAEQPMRPAVSAPLPAIGRGLQSGFSLIVALMMLIVIIILGVSAAQMAVNEERSARGNRDRQLAFQAAEAALRDAEYEILNDASPPCTAGNLAAHGRAGTSTCFDSGTQTGFELGCSALPNAGLCTYVDMSSACVPTAAAGICPAYLDGANVDFYADASAASGHNNHTIGYGQYTGRVFPSQATLPGLPAYPPRYIIERVPKNLGAINAQGKTDRLMFRITAMGFGANANSQVVLQSIVNVNLD